MEYISESSFLPLFLQLQPCLPIWHYIVDHCNVGVVLLWYQWILHCIMIWSLFTQDYIMMFFIVLPIWKTASTVGSLELLATIKELKKHTNGLTLRLQPSGFASLPSVAPEPLPSGNGDFVKHAWRSSTDGSVEWSLFKTSCKNNWSVAVSIWASKKSSANALRQLRLLRQKPVASTFAPGTVSIAEEPQVDVKGTRRTCYTVEYISESSFLPLFLQLQPFLPISHYIVDHCNIGVVLLRYQWILHCIMIWSLFTQRSAHTALAVKACLLGCKTATLNAQVTFVNIAVAISALAGGGHSKNFAPSPSWAGVFVFFGRFLGVAVKEGIEMEYWVVLERLEIYWDVILGRFGGYWGGMFKSFWVVVGCFFDDLA